MVSRCSASRCLALATCACFFFGCYLASLPFNETQSSGQNTQYQKSPGAEHPLLSPVLSDKFPAYEKPRLAIIVPFRDRFEELLDFVPHMHSVLIKQDIPFDIFVMQQRDSFRFNRASLINAGFLYTHNTHRYIAMHDVDLLPLNDQLRYDYPAEGPMHLSAPELHPKYHYSTFIGGILLITNEHFQLVNGLSNKYWGWGLEDDEFYVRLKDAGLAVRRPTNITTGTDNTFRHVHDAVHRRRDTRKCFTQRESTRKRDRVTGLHDLKYAILKRRELTVDGLPCVVVDVELKCDRNDTPWCLCDQKAKADVKKSQKTFT